MRDLPWAWQQVELQFIGIYSIMASGEAARRFYVDGKESLGTP